LHAVLCAAGFNIRWLMRALWRQVQAGGLKHVFLAVIGLRAICVSAFVAVLQASPERWANRTWSKLNA